MAKNSNHIKVKDFEKKITIVAVMIVAGLIGAYTLGFSFAAKGGGGKSGKNQNDASYITKATDQEASSYLLGELVRERGVKMWRTSAPRKGGETTSYANWRSKQAFVGFSSGTYRSCISFRTNKSADVQYGLQLAGQNKGASLDHTFTGVTSSNAHQELCRDFLISSDNDKSGQSDWALYSSLRILNDATLDITESTLTKIN